MYNARQLGYLELLGVDAWALRRPGAQAPVAPEASEAAHEAPAAPVDEMEARIQQVMPGSTPGDAPVPPESGAGPRKPRRALKELLSDAPAAAVAEASGAAGQAVVAARDWTTLHEQVAACNACRLCEHRTHTVFGAGAQTAEVLFVGEGPGAEEDRVGEPFVGAAGQLLDRMLAAIDHSRAQDHLNDVYIANVVKCRPPGNRKPHADEATACADFLDAQIDLIQPRLIVALGAAAATRLLDSDLPVGKLRSQQDALDDAALPQYKEIPVLVTYHPAYYLRSPQEKRKGWDDLKRIRRLLASAL